MAKLTLSFKSHPQKIYTLAECDVFIGRDTACEICIDSLAVLPRHARINWDGAGYVLAAIEKDASLRVNNRKIGEHALSNGDIFHVGKHTLTFTDDLPRSHKPWEPKVARMPATGWLQITEGPQLGRIIRLDKQVTRVGRAGVSTAEISRHNNEYFVSHLEGNQLPSVNGVSIGDQACQLQDGDVVEIDDMRLEFYLEECAGSGQSHGTAAGSREETATQRRFTRVSFDATVTLAANNQQWVSRLIDLSLRGALIVRPERWTGSAGDRCKIVIRVSNTSILRMDVRVAHIHEQQLGLSCTSIDNESLAELRWLVELNLGNPDLLDRELSALG
jgi:pSer/pThr/pTyr-binding forkhead associated (FHA) protein